MQQEFDNLVSYRNVSFRRDGRMILKNINWDIKKGENWALLGLNGSGKTTLLAMLNAYTMASSGDLWVFNKRFGSFPWEYVQKKIGYVSSSLNHYSSTWANDNIVNIVLSGKFASIGIYDKVTDEDLKKAENLVEIFELSYLKDTGFYFMSQGEQRRALIARAMMSDYDLLVLDEPCAALDVRARENLLKSLESVATKDKKSFIYVTHNIEEILPVVSHVAILDDGVIVAKGKKEEILTENILSKLYGIDVSVVWENSRPFLIVK